MRSFTAILACVVVAIASGVVAVALRLQGNVRSVSLSGTAGAAPAREGSPLDILLIGSDSRASAADCALGGACSAATTSKAAGAAHQGGNADVQMLIHLAADRSHAEVVSIPRDTIVDIPACTDGTTTLPARRDRINSSLQAGVDCTVRSVERLAGLGIEHVAVVDFHGVVTLSDALGGVPVCVDADVYDPYSKLKLKAGTHEMKGESALHFVRTRHGFGNGGDLGRTGAQHLFLSSLIRQLRSGSTLSDPIKMFAVADAATKALTVDEPLASASALVGLVRELDQVPSDSITFMTMPATPDTNNPNVLATTPQTHTLFQRLARDERPTPKPSPRSGSASSSSSAPPTGSNGAARPLVSPSTPTQPTPMQATTGGCAHVSTRPTVVVNGSRMTPTEAYRAAVNIPDSAP